MKPLNSISAVFFLVLAVGCRKSPYVTTHEYPLPFAVSVVSRTENNASIEWTQAVSLLDSVRYKITLDNKLIDSNLITTSYKLSNLSGDKEYKGEIVAYSNRAPANTTVANFSLGKVEGYLYLINPYPDRISCISANSGQIIWEYGNFEFSDYYRLHVVISNDTLFAGGNGVFVALEAKTGKLIWRTVLKSLQQIHHAPVYKDGVVYAAGDDNLFAIDAKTGREKWAFKIGYNLNPPTVAGSKVFVCGGGEGHVYAIDKENGAKAWEYVVKLPPTGGTSSIQGNPVVYDGKLIVNSFSGDLIALDQNNGTVLWKCKIGLFGYTSQFRSPALYKGNVIVMGDANMIGYDGKFRLFSINANSGVINWSVPGFTDEGFESPVVAGDRIFMQKETAISAIDAKTGNSLWSIPYNGFKYLLPANDALYVSGKSIGGSNVICSFDPATGVKKNELYILQNFGFAFLKAAMFNGTTAYPSESGMVQ